MTATANKTSPSTGLSPGLPGLYVELYWGTELTEARTFNPDMPEVVGGPSEGSPLPMYGYTMSGETHLLARRTEKGYRIYPPPAVTIERRAKGESPVAVEREALPKEGDRPYFELEQRGVAVTLREGHLRIVMQASVAVRRIPKITVKDVVTIGFILIAFLAAPVGFLMMGMSSQDPAALNARALEAAREEALARQAELDRLYPSLPAGTVDAGSNVQRIALPAAVSVQ